MKELLLLLQLTVRLVLVGRATDPKIKLVANDKIEVHGWIQKPAVMSPVEFTIPAEATKDGALKLRWAARLRSGWIQRLHRPRRGLPDADQDALTAIAALACVPAPRRAQVSSQRGPDHVASTLTVATKPLPYANLVSYT